MNVRELNILIGTPADMVRGCDLMGKENINIRAFAIANDGGEGQMHVVVDNPVKALLVLKSNGFKVLEGEVIGVEAPDHPGALASILKILVADGVRVRYIYATVEKMRENAVIIIAVDDIAGAIGVLQSNWFKVLPAEDVYSL